MTPLVDTKDLIDARDVAEIIGLSQPGNVSLYQRRYPDMPRPVVTLGRGRCMLWLRPEIDQWARDLATSGRTRPKRRASASAGWTAISLAPPADSGCHGTPTCALATPDEAARG